MLELPPFVRLPKLPTCGSATGPTLCGRCTCGIWQSRPASPAPARLSIGLPQAPAWFAPSACASSGMNAIPAVASEEVKNIKCLSDIIPYSCVIWGMNDENVSS